MSFSDNSVHFGSLLVALFLIAGTIWFPNSVVMWLASGSLAMDIARAVLAAMMIGLIITVPPRSFEFRALLGVMSLGFGSWAVMKVFSGSVQLIDCVLFVQAAISFALAAIEGEPQTDPDDVIDLRAYAAHRRRVAKAQS